MSIGNYYSMHSHLVYLWALEEAGKGQDVYVAEIQYPHPHSPIYYQAYKGEYPSIEPGMSHFIVETAIPGFDMFGKLDNHSLRIINKVMRRIDESNLWPICGEFNAIERAIRRLRGRDFDCPYLYWTSLENEISSIVNEQV